MLKRFGLFLAMNFAVLAMFSIALVILKSVFGIDLNPNGGKVDLIAYALIWGMLASFFSLFLSKWSAKRAYHITLLEKEDELYQMVEKISKEVGLKTPEVGVYHSEDVNAFATGWSKNNSLVAVSSEMLRTFNRTELEGVLGHEIAHIKNGDMVTMALMQGVINAFVVVASRLSAIALKNTLGDALGGLAETVLYITLQIVFGILASPILMAFSRYREYKADSGSATLVGKEKMISALEKIKKSVEFQNTPKELVVMGIQGKRSSFGDLFSSHPNLDDRINKLKNKSAKNLSLVK